MSFLHEGEEHRVAEISEQSLEEDSETGERRMVFLLKDEERSDFKLIHWIATDTWTADL